MITEVADSSQVAEARRLVGNFAHQLGLSDARTADVALVVTELATNLLKHAGRGLIHAAAFQDRDGSGLEVMALDQGAGMADLNLCLRDGYSTAGSPGTGLGAITRLADQVQIFSRADRGTVLMARFVMAPPEAGPETQIGAAVAPYPGEIVCGDGWAFGMARSGRTLMVVDGSGHGVEAARAANIAVDTFRQHIDEACEGLVDRLHRALRPTRGAALAVARIDDAARTVRYCGIGNIAGALHTDGALRHMVSHNGTAGHIVARIREFTYDFAGTPLVILHSDGLTTRWDLGAYPGLPAQHPSLTAGVLLRDHRRGRDDASVVAMRALL